MPHRTCFLGTQRDSRATTNYSPAQGWIVAYPCTRSAAVPIEPSMVSPQFSLFGRWEGRTDPALPLPTSFPHFPSFRWGKDPYTVSCTDIRALHGFLRFHCGGEEGTNEFHGFWVTFSHIGCMAPECICHRKAPPLPVRVGQSVGVGVAVARHSTRYGYS